jgi:anti-repressor protein
MSHLQLFNYEGSQVRTVFKDGEPFWVAKDVCDILEIGSPTDAVKRLDDDEVDSIEVADSFGRNQKSNCVTESGLYSLILGSRKPEAKAFKRWVTHDVLPTIRKTGSYSTMDPQQLIALALVEAQKVIENKDKQIAIMQPKAQFFDAVADSKSAIEFGKAAKVLAIRGFGRNNLFEFLRNEGVLMDGNIPKQRYIDSGYFRVIEQKWTDKNLETQINIKTLVYQKGLDWIRKLIEKEKANRTNG